MAVITLRDRHSIRCSGLATQVKLVQADNFAWFGFPDDTEPSSREFVPGLKPVCFLARHMPAWLPCAHCMQAPRRRCCKGSPEVSVAGLDCLARKATEWSLQAVHQPPCAPAAGVEPHAAPAASPQPGPAAAGAAPLTMAKLLSKLSKAEAQKGMLPAPDSALNFRPSVRLHGYLGMACWALTLLRAPCCLPTQGVPDATDNRHSGSQHIFHRPCLSVLCAMMPGA